MTQPTKVAKPLPAAALPGNAVKDPKTGALTPRTKAKTQAPAEEKVQSIGHNSDAEAVSEIIRIFDSIMKLLEDIKGLQGAVKDAFAVLREKGIPTKQARMIVALQKLEPADRINFIHDLMLADEAMTQGELFRNIITEEARNLLTTRSQGLEDPDASPEEPEAKEESAEEAAAPKKKGK